MNMPTHSVQACAARFRTLLMVLMMMTAAFAVSMPTYAQSDVVDPGEVKRDGQVLAHYHVGVFYQARGDHERAIAEFTFAIDALPEPAYVYAARGDSYAAIGSYDDAIRDYSAAIDIYPDFVSVLYMRGRAYAALGSTVLATADYINAIEQMPEYANPYWGLGDLYYEAGNYADALESYQRHIVLEANPDVQVMARIEQLQSPSHAI